nr:dihydrofolate reductase family protein [Kineosphaera limosa]
MTIVESLSLDGVMQAPGRPDEDTRDGFDAGGWGVAYGDEVAAREMGAGMMRPSALLFGRRTYEDFHRAWGGRTDNPFTPVLAAKTKYVVTNTLTDPLPWENSHALRGDAIESVTRLKKSGGDDLVLLGCGELARTLIDAGLVDEYTLLIHPLVLGQGQQLFPRTGLRRDLALKRCVPTTTGVVVATYAPV